MSAKRNCKRKFTGFLVTEGQKNLPIAIGRLIDLEKYRDETLNLPIAKFRTVEGIIPGDREWVDLELISFHGILVTYADLILYDTVYHTKRKIPESYPGDIPEDKIPKVSKDNMERFLRSYVEDAIPDVARDNMKRLLRSYAENKIHAGIAPRYTIMAVLRVKDREGNWIIAAVEDERMEFVKPEYQDSPLQILRRYGANSLRLFERDYPTSETNIFEVGYARLVPGKWLRQLILMTIDNICLTSVDYNDWCKTDMFQDRLEEFMAGRYQSILDGKVQTEDMDIRWIEDREIDYTFHYEIEDDGFRLKLKGLTLKDRGENEMMTVKRVVNPISSVKNIYYIGHAELPDGSWRKVAIAHASPLGEELLTELINGVYGVNCRIEIVSAHFSEKLLNQYLVYTDMGGSVRTFTMVKTFVTKKKSIREHIKGYDEKKVEVSAERQEELIKEAFHELFFGQGDDESEDPMFKDDEPEDLVQEFYKKQNAITLEEWMKHWPTHIKEWNHLEEEVADRRDMGFQDMGFPVEVQQEEIVRDILTYEKRKDKEDARKRFWIPEE